VEVLSEDYDMDVDTPRAIALHLDRMHSYRNDAAKGQEKSRAEMLKTTREKLKPMMKGDPVLIPVSESDRGRLDCRNVPGVILDVKDEMYKIGTVHGVVNTRLARNQILQGEAQIVTPDMVREEVLPFRKIASLHSKFGGQGFSKCSCQGTCSTKRCNCLKNNTKCHSHCHPLNKTCKNKEL
jgi:hypothetical protein